MTSMFYTYMHSRADTGVVFYIGKGVRKRAWDFNRRNPKWKNIAAKHGVNVEICARWGTEEEALQHETLLISCMKDLGINLANIADGGNGPTGYKFTPEQKLKMSIKRKGKKLSPEVRAKIAAAQKGRPGKAWTEEDRIKASMARKGRPGKPMSDEAKKKLSENNGSKRPEVKAKIAATLRGGKASDESRIKRSLATKGVPKPPEHVAKIRAGRLAYFQRQRELHGKAQTISEEHKQALRKGFNKHYGIENEDHK